MFDKMGQAHLHIYKSQVVNSLESYNDTYNDSSAAAGLELQNPIQSISMLDIHHITLLLQHQHTIYQ